PQQPQIPYTTLFRPQPGADFGLVAERDAQASERGDHTRQRDQDPRSRHSRLGGVSDIPRREMPQHRHQEDRGIQESTYWDEVERSEEHTSELQSHLN